MRDLKSCPKIVFGSGKALKGLIAAICVAGMPLAANGAMTYTLGGGGGTPTFELSVTGVTNGTPTFTTDATLNWLGTPFVPTGTITGASNSDSIVTDVGSFTTSSVAGNVLTTSAATNIFKTGAGWAGGHSSGTRPNGALTFTFDLTGLPSVSTLRISDITTANAGGDGGIVQVVVDGVSVQTVALGAVSGLSIDISDGDTLAFRNIGTGTNDYRLKSFTFDDATAAPPVRLEINRDTGAVTLVNPSDTAIAFYETSLTSSRGALAPGNWQSITDNYDSNGNSSVSDTPWITTSTEKTDLSEIDNGFSSAGTLANGDSIDFGTGLWLKGPNESDMTFSYTDNSTQQAVNVAVQFVGNGGEAYAVGDLNFDGEINAADWPTVRDNYGSDFSAMTVAESYQVGDLDGNGLVNSVDFSMFKDAYLAANPNASFGALVGATSVPEPATWALMVLGLAAVAGRRSKHLLKAPLMKKCMFALVAMLAFASSASAVIVKPTAATSSITSDAGGSVDWLLNDNPNQALFSLQRPVDTEVLIDDGSDVADALATFHQHGGQGHQESWTRGTGQGNPVFSFDLGSERSIGSILLWGYGNNGGGDGRNGNATREFEVIFHTAAEGATFDFDSAAGGGTEAVEFSGTMYRPDPADTASNGAQGFNFDSLQTAQYVGLRIASNYLGEPEVIAGGDRYGLGEVRFATENDLPDPPPIPNLTLQVNTETGNVAILSDGTETFDIELYEIRTTDAQETLDPAKWTSIEATGQNGLPQGDGSGNGWEALGTPSTTFLGEGYLTSSSEIAPGNNINLDAAYDPLVIGQGIDGNLEFNFQVAGEAIRSGNVVYVSTAGVTGDYNGDGTVNAADYTVWRDNLGSSVTPGMGADGNDNGVIDAADYSVWKSNFGLTGNAAGSLKGAAVPEPATAVLGLLGLVGLAGVARRSAA